MTVVALTPQPDDEAVIEAVAPLLRDSFPLHTLALDPAAWPQGFWRQVVELGWLGASLDEAHGGGFDLVQDALMNREYGRWLAPLSLLSTALGARVLAHAAGEPPEAILTGVERIGLAAQIAPAPLGPAPEGEAHLIDPDADRFLLAGPQGALVLPRDAFDALTPIQGLDPTVALARARLSGASGVWLAAEAEPVALRMQVLLAAQLVGVAQAASAMATDYAKVRVQFGKPIGAFQAVAHMCADMAVRAHAADAMLALAAIALRDGWADAEVQAMAAARVAADAAMLAATNNIQVHGGMGYSAESGAHLYLKRAVLLKRLLPLQEREGAILLGHA